MASFATYVGNCDGLTLAVISDSTTVLENLLNQQSFENVEQQTIYLLQLAFQDLPNFAINLATDSLDTSTSRHSSVANQQKFAKLALQSLPDIAFGYNRLLVNVLRTQVKDKAELTDTIDVIL